MKGFVVQNRFSEIIVLIYDPSNLIKSLVMKPDPINTPTTTEIFLSSIRSEGVVNPFRNYDYTVAKLTLEEFKYIISELSKLSEDQHIETALRVYLRNPATEISLEEFKGILEKVKSDFRLDAVTMYLENTTTEINLAEFCTTYSEVLGESDSDVLGESDSDEVLGESGITLATAAYLTNPTTKITLEELKGFIVKPIIDPLAAIAYLRNPAITLGKFSDILAEFRNRDEETKSDLVQAYLKHTTTEITPERFKGILAEFKDEETRLDLVQEYLERTTTEITPEGFKGILAEFKDEQTKLGLVQAYLEHPQTKITEGLLIEVILKMLPADSKYDYEVVLAVCSFINNPPGLSMAFLQQVATDLYPSAEAMQIGLLAAGIIGNQINSANFKELDLSKIKDDDLVLDFISILKSKIPSLAENNILTLCRGRFSAKYQSLATLFKGKVSECLTEKGLEELDLLGLFGAEFSPEVTISDLFSYYDMIPDTLVNLIEKLKPELAEKIKNDFKPSDKILLVNNSDIKKFSQITGVVKEAIQGEFISNKLLCKLFSKVDILPLTPEEKGRFEINFETSAHNDSRQESLNTKIRKILTNPTKHDVADFFETIVNKEVTLESNKLFDAWKKSENMITAILKTAGGLESLTLALYTIGDGCAANIGSKISMIAYSALLGMDTARATLFEVLDEITNTILNRGGDVIESYTDPMKNPRVQEYYLSPDYLLTKIASKFNISNATDFINSKLVEGQQLHIILKDSLDEKGEILEKTITNIAAYLVLKETIGETEANKTKFKKDGGPILDKVLYQIKAAAPSAEIANPSSANLSLENPVPNI